MAENLLFREQRNVRGVGVVERLKNGIGQDPLNGRVRVIPVRDEGGRWTGVRAGPGSVAGN